MCVDDALERCAKAAREANQHGHPLRRVKLRSCGGELRLRSICDQWGVVERMDLLRCGCGTRSADVIRQGHHLSISGYDFDGVHERLTASPRDVEYRTKLLNVIMIVAIAAAAPCDDHLQDQCGLIVCLALDFNHFVSHIEWRCCLSGTHGAGEWSERLRRRYGWRGSLGGL